VPFALNATAATDDRPST